MKTHALLLVLVGCSGSPGSPIDGGGPDGGSKPDSSGDGAMPGTDSGMDAVADTAGDAMDGAMNDDAGPGVYSAYFVAGGLDRVFVYKADSNRNLCFEVRLRSPDNQTGGLMLPATWGLEQAGVWDDALACDPNYGGNGTFTDATSQSGTVTWQGATPQSVDVDVVLTLTMPEKLKAMNVPVQ